MLSALQHFLQALLSSSSFDLYISSVRHLVEQSSCQLIQLCYQPLKSILIRQNLMRTPFILNLDMLLLTDRRYFVAVPGRKQGQE
jgi:hypothetical protein